MRPSPSSRSHHPPPASYSDHPSLLVTKAIRMASRDRFYNVRDNTSTRIACRIELSLKPKASIKKVEKVFFPGKNVNDAKEEPQRTTKEEEKCTMSSATSETTALLNTAAITAALKDILRKNDVELCSKIVTGFSAKEKDAISDCLSKELAEFEIHVYLKKSWQRATLRLLGELVQLMVKNRKLIHEPYSIGLEIKAQKGSQFILKSSNGSSYTCDTEDGIIGRDKIMVTTKAFLMKAFLLDEPKPTWTKPPPGCLKLNTFACISKIKGVGGIGGSVRDDSGNWITGFWGKVTIADRMKLRFMALKEGLGMSLKIGGLRKIIIEVDSLIMERLLKGTIKVPLDDPCYGLAWECRGLLNKLGECNHEVVLAERSANALADWLSMAGHELPCWEVKTSNEPPQSLRLVVLQEKTGLPSYLLQKCVK